MRITELIDRARSLLLRFFLSYCALGWGVCLVGVVAPAQTVFKLLGAVGGVDPHPLAADPMYDYWLRMASGVFGMIGLGYLALAVWPDRFRGLLPVAGAFMLVEGALLAIHELRLNLPPSPFHADVTFCCLGGLGVLACLPRQRPASRG